jgi:hypothetical protein
MSPDECEWGRLVAHAERWRRGPCLNDREANSGAKPGPGSSEGLHTLPGFTGHYLIEKQLIIYGVASDARAMRVGITMRKR